MDEVRRASWHNFDLGSFDGEGEFNIPLLEPITELPDINQWIRFNYAKSMVKTKRNQVGIHFYVDDYQFDRVWKSPNAYIEFLSQFGCVMSPDFSLFHDFPKALNVYNHYRNQWLGRYWQTKGIKVIPSVGWCGKDSYEWCFDGVPKHSILAVSNVGTVNSSENSAMWIDGYNTMLEKLEPIKVLVFSKSIGDYPGPVKYIKYDRW